MKPNDKSFTFYGTASVGEKGQIVIPAEARKAMGLKPGDKFLVMAGHHNDQLMLMRPEAISEIKNRMDTFVANLKKAEEEANGK